MSKKVLVKFADGLKEVGEGDTVYCYGGYGTTGNQMISAIGRKYITIAGRRENQYYIDSGSEFCDGNNKGQLWTSKESFETIKDSSDFIHAFKDLFLLRQIKTSFTKEMVIQAAEVLGLTDQLNEGVAKEKKSNRRD